MNTCILMAKIIRNPELRYTPDNQLAISEMLVEFPGVREEDPPATIKALGWGNLASEIQENYVSGDHVLIQGGLKMNLVDMPEGYKEKRAEFNISRIHKLSSSDFGGMTPSQTAPATSASANSDNVVPFDSFKSTSSGYEDPALGVSIKSQTPETSSIPSSTPLSPDPDQDLDDIPFVRPVGPRNNTDELQDSWEIAANQPGYGLHGFSDLCR